MLFPARCTELEGITDVPCRILKRLILITLESSTLTIGLSAANVMCAWRAPDGVIMTAVVRLETHPPPQQSAPCLVA